MEWVDPSKRNVNKTLFCVSSDKLSLNDMSLCWELKIKPIDANKLSKRKYFNEIKNPEEQVEYASYNSNDT